MALRCLILASLPGTSSLETLFSRVLLTAWSKQVSLVTIGALQHTVISSLHALGQALVTQAINRCNLYEELLLWGLRFVGTAGSLNLVPRIWSLRIVIVPEGQLFLPSFTPDSRSLLQKDAVNEMMKQSQTALASCKLHSWRHWATGGYARAYGKMQTADGSRFGIEDIDDSRSRTWTTTSSS